MMNTLNYFVEANLCLAVFYFLFRRLLNRETNASFNRMYLLGAILLSVITPLFQPGRLDYNDYELNYFSPKISAIFFSNAAPRRFFAMITPLGSRRMENGIALML